MAEASPGGEKDVALGNGAADDLDPPMLSCDASPEGGLATHEGQLPDPVRGADGPELGQGRTEHAEERPQAADQGGEGDQVERAPLLAASGPAGPQREGTRAESDAPTATRACGGSPQGAVQLEAAAPKAQDAEDHADQGPAQSPGASSTAKSDDFQTALTKIRQQQAALCEDLQHNDSQGTPGPEVVEQSREEGALMRGGASTGSPKAHEESVEKEEGTRKMMMQQPAKRMMAAVRMRA